MSKEEDFQEERSLAGKGGRLVQFKGSRMPPAIDLLPTARYADVSQVGKGAQPDVKGFTGQVTATAQSTQILPADPSRKFLFFSNDDALGYARISFGVEATLTTGIKIAPGGGGILLDNNVPTAAVFIIGSIATNPNITMVVA